MQIAYAAVAGVTTASGGAVSAVAVARGTFATDTLTALTHYLPRVRRPDIERALRLLGWEPQVDRKEGLRRTLSYFQQRLREDGRIVG